MEIWQYALALATVGVGACLQGSIGFGMGLLASPILALVSHTLVPVPLLVIAILMTGLLAVRERRAGDRRGIGWAVLGRVPGSALGAAAVAYLPMRGLDATFGVLILLAVGFSIVGWAPAPSRGVLLTAGTLSGLMGTAASTGAAPVALVYQGTSGANLRATLSGFFFVGSTMSLVVLAVFGQVGVDELRTAGLLVPPMLAGVALSKYVAPHLDAGNTRVAILTVAGLASVGLLTRAVLG